MKNFRVALLSLLLLILCVTNRVQAQNADPVALPAKDFEKWSVDSIRPVDTYKGRIIAIDANKNTVKLVLTNIKSVRPVEVEVLVNATTQMEVADIPPTKLSVGDTVYWGSSIGFHPSRTQRDVATITSLKPLTLHMEGGAKKIAVNIVGEDYAFTWDSPPRHDGQHYRQSAAWPFIWAAPDKVNFRVINQTTYRYEIRDFATLILTVKEPLSKAAEPTRFTADKATIILKKADGIRLTRFSPLKISELKIGQEFVVGAIIQPDKTLAAQQFITTYRPKTAEPKIATPAKESSDRSPSNPAGLKQLALPRRESQ